MRLLHHQERDFDRAVASIAQASAASDPAVASSVAGIIDQVRRSGDRALLSLTAKFDGFKAGRPQALRVTDREIPSRLPTALKRALEDAHRNVALFARKGLPRNWEVRNRHGARVGEKHLPYRRVGIYVPGGTAPLVSTCLMTITLAKCAGVPEIVVCTPAGKGGKVNSALLYAARLAGATEIYKIGGAQAIAAMALGTETIGKVHKIAGPGNAYVTEAKRQLYGHVDIDMIAGPSEVLILADSSAHPDWIAMDLLAQAEHGTGRERAILVTDNARLALETMTCLTRLLPRLKRASLTRQVVENRTFLLVARSMTQAVQVANEIAPEHLEIHARNARPLAARLTTAGALFIGDHTPESVGDYIAGPSHVLPTGGSARSFSGLTVSSFLRRSSLIEYSRENLRKGLPSLKQFALIEGLEAHGLSAAIRFQS